jgi:large subunit ribosomal protein L13
MKTFSPTPKDISHNWFVVDASDKILGRLATALAVRLRGKHKAEYCPHLDTGDYIVVVNAAKVLTTGRKLDQKKYYRHSGWIGGLKETSLRDMLAKKPEDVIRKAVRGMLPKNRLGRAMLKKLKVYAGEAHPHEAQKPATLDV